ncbi:MAG: hypothetical protein JST54_15205 [Deltaproteobacteria bacterium]|nr:hypothetical protein [Deltaproteobacteria bacterium]
MNLRPILLAAAVLCSAGTAAAEPPRVTASTLPSWWPAAQFGKSSVVTAEDYGEAQFNTTADATSGGDRRPHR